MKDIDNTLFFDSDDEFADFCVAPYAEVKEDARGRLYVEGKYSDMYLSCIEQGMTFVIRDWDSKVYKRGCVCKRVPVLGTNRTTLIQLDVQDVEVE